MLTMLTFRAGKFVALAILVCLALVCLGACSREQQDWRSAEASDTVDGYARFLKQHPDSELVTEARTRFAQLSEDREWQRAGEADTADAYKQFLAQHPNGKWAQEARIRIENFALGAEGTAATAPNNAAGSAAGVSSGAGGPAATVSNAAAGSAGAASSAAATGTSAGSMAASGSAVVSPGETARAPTPAPMVAGEAAQISTSPSAAAQVPTSPSPATYGYTQPAAPTQTPSVIGTAWRPANSGATAYGVQLGAFASENAAASEWEQLTARFSAQLRGLVPHVVSAETTTGHLFRLQALVADEATARALCDMLKRQSQACVPVLPH
jgi:cell division septation protein DedD